MGGRIFNLKNTVPDELGDHITTELSALVVAAKDEVQCGNRRLAQVEPYQNPRGLRLELGWG